MVLLRNTPDSGWAWIILVTTFSCQMLTASFSYSVGIIKLAFLDKYGGDPIKADWIGSSHVAISQMAGPLVSLALSRFNCRTLVFFSGIVAAMGFLLSVFVDNIDFLFLTFGAVAGLGQGFCYTTAIVSLGYYFRKRLYFASGIAATGAGVGLMLFPPLIQKLIATYGLDSALLILSGFGLQFCVLGSLIAPNRQEASAKRQLPDLRVVVSTESLKANSNIFRNYSLDVYLLSIFLWNLAYAFLSQSLPLYSSFTGNSREEAALLLSLTGIGSMLGRFLGGIAANDGEIDGIIFYFGPNGVLALLSLLFPLYGKSYMGQAFYAICLGLYTGSSISVQGPIVVRLVGVEMMAAGYGVLMFVNGISSLIGPPLGGWMMAVAPFLEVGFFSAGVSLFLSCLTGMAVILLEKRRHDEAVQKPSKIRSRSLSINKFGTSIYTLNDLTLEVTKDASGRFRTETLLSERLRTETTRSETSSFI